MGACVARDSGLPVTPESEHERLFDFLQEAKRAGKLLPPPLTEREWSVDDVHAIENPPDHVWRHVSDETAQIAFRFPSTWQLLDPIEDGPRFTRTVRTGFKHREHHIFCVCELSVTVVQLSKAFKTESDFFEEMQRAGDATKPTSCESAYGDTDGRRALITCRTYTQEDGSITRVIDKHSFVQQRRVGISLLAFFADTAFFNRYRAVANKFFQSTKIS
eukprot:TRINITY_DN22601_c0_g1_i1.p1 TRINITY_DN22601_c0_g1~~TRINITY_DN22601_c0_g1_i1.p1  ORF type:complete len:218 (+),score=17.95 TRINITY_DN22601_c0_g1_i1:205-858(+)